MAKDIVIPPIRKNPRLGKETEEDASVMFGGARAAKSDGVKEKPKKRRKPMRRSKQKSFTIKNQDQLARLVEKLGMSEAAVVNLGIAYVAKEFL
jgi:hypothetical protein